jgi:hypothetical protein
MPPYQGIYGTKNRILRTKLRKGTKLKVYKVMGVKLGLSRTKMLVTLKQQV